MTDVIANKMCNTRQTYKLYEIHKRCFHDAENEENNERSKTDLTNMWNNIGDIRSNALSPPEWRAYASVY